MHRTPNKVKPRWPANRLLLAAVRLAGCGASGRQFSVQLLARVQQQCIYGAVSSRPPRSRDTHTCLKHTHMPAILSLCHSGTRLWPGGGTCWHAPSLA